MELTSPAARMPVQWAIKRLVDFVLGAVLSLVALVPLLLASLAVLIEDGWPAFFTQPRAAGGGRSFTIVKLRTMKVNDLSVSEVGQVSTDHPLVTRVGRIARATKLDELPQLLNVLAGDMSLIGPRPAMPEFAAEYDAFANQRLLVPPGMTGWAQINGNTEVSWDERILLDVWYVKHWSLWLDARILVRTIGVIIGGERANTAAVQTAYDDAKRADRGGRE